MASWKYIILLILSLGLAACGGDSDITSETTSDDEVADEGTGNDTGDSSGDDSLGDDSSGLSLTVGFDQVVTRGSTVQLVATASGNDSLSWVQISGATVSLSDSTADNPTFTAPDVSENTDFVFEVMATDTNGTSVTESVSVEVWVPFDQSDLTTLGDFSVNDDWQCTVDTGIEPSVVQEEIGLSVSIATNAIPDYAVGTFPNAGNPNTISEQQESYSYTIEPEVTGSQASARVFGITLDGMTFQRETGECYNNETSCDWRYEAITPGVASNAGDTSWAGSGSNWIGTDCNNAHVQPTGNYHYHGLPESLINKLGDGGDKMVLMGHAADGFPIYGRWGYSDPNDATSEIVRMSASYNVISGTRPSGPGGEYSGIFLQDWEYVEGSGDLDECSGRVGVTPEYPDGIYHYYLTDDYPYVPLCMLGTPDDSFSPRPF